MRFGIVVGLFLSASAFQAFAQDPAKSDGDKYKVIMENDRVRVLEYKDKPGEKTSQHHHPDFVLYALSDFNRKLTLGNGKQVIKELKNGDVIWMKDQIHIGENIGKTETHALIVELKEAPKAPVVDTVKPK
jgi:quercetin dioxygenase-like cupin family protein